MTARPTGRTAMEIYFVRHAQPNFENHCDMARELTPKGLQDRTLVTEYLRDKNISAVLSSPFKRAADTVREFAENQGLSMETVDGFRERRVDGAWIEDFEAFARRQWEDFDYRLSGGECLREVMDRGAAALRWILEEHAGQNVAVGSHGTALSALIHAYDPSFGYGDFTRIQGLMPWIVHFSFEGQACVGIEEYDLFTNTVTKRK